MKIIVGLGNPGKKFVGTRHNLGEELVRIFQQKNQFPAFKKNTKFNALTSRGFFLKQKLLLAIPLTFMNASGIAIKKILSFYKEKPRNLLVIIDDFALPLSVIRLRNKGSAGGHKGLQSIIDHLRSENFPRLRIGIKPEKEIKKPLEEFVLEKFDKKEKKEVNKLLPQILEEINKFINPKS